MQPKMSNNTCDILLCHYLSTKIKPKCGKLWEKPSTLLLYPQELGRRKETASACISIQADLLEVCWFGAFRCVLIQCQAGKTPAMTLMSKNIQDSCRSSHEWTQHSKFTPKVKKMQFSEKLQRVAKS